MRNVVLSIFTLFIGFHILADSALSEKKLVIDAIVASVNGEPITLSDIEKVLGDNQKLTLDAASSDPEVRLVVEQLILERLIYEEAKERNLGVSDGEIERYIDEVTRRNRMDRASFEAALKKEGKTITGYKEQIKTEILKTKIASGFMQSGVAVSEDEIDEHIKELPALNKSGAKVKLSQIFISTADRSEEAARREIEKAQTELEEGSSFSTVAKSMSEGVEASEGGSLGVIPEEDLGMTIFDALFGLEEGEVTSIVTSENGLHLFKLEERFVQSEDDEEEVNDSLRGEIREQLKRRKLEERMQEFFTLELQKLHAVDKKI